MEVAVLIAVCFFFTLWRVEKLAKKYLGDKIAPVPPLQAGKDRPPIPSGLLVYAANWSDKWATEDTMAKLNELYDQTGSWEGVAASIEAD
jgi:hypothetical protein